MNWLLEVGCSWLIDLYFNGDNKKETHAMILYLLSKGLNSVLTSCFEDQIKKAKEKVRFFQVVPHRLNDKHKLRLR